MPALKGLACSPMSSDPDNVQQEGRLSRYVSMSIEVNNAVLSRTWDAQSAQNAPSSEPSAQETTSYNHEVQDQEMSDETSAGEQGMNPHPSTAESFNEADVDMSQDVPDLPAPLLTQEPSQLDKIRDLAYRLDLSTNPILQGSEDWTRILNQSFLPNFGGNDHIQITHEQMLVIDQMPLSFTSLYQALVDSSMNQISVPNSPNGSGFFTAYWHNPTQTVSA